MARNYLNCTLRFSLTLLVSLLLFGVASFAQASTAQAADTVTSGYGAGVNPTGNRHFRGQRRHVQRWQRDGLYYDG